MARRNTGRRPRSRSENLMLVVGILVAISMVLSGVLYMMQ